MKRNIYRFSGMVILLCVLNNPIYTAASYSSQISDVEDQQQETQSNLDETEEEIQNLEDEKSEMEDYLTDLNSQLSDLSSTLDDLETQITDKLTEIETTEEKLEEAKVQEEKQYASMKTRIRFMYEKGDTTYVTLLLESQNLSDLLNKAEYVSKIYDYDREMLVKYQNTKTEIEDQQTKLTQEKEELLALQDEVEEKEDNVSSLVTTTSTQIDSYSEQISDVQNEASEYEAELLKQEEQLEELKAKEAAEKQAAEKKKAEEAAKKAAEKESSTSTGDTQESSENSEDVSDEDNDTNAVQAGSDSTSASDLQLMAAIIECEAASESTEGKLAVGSVVMNRVSSSSYPNTIVGVIYQSGQFTPVTSGRFSIVLARGSNSSCVEVAQKVLNGYSSGSWCYFCRNYGLVEGDVIGNHVFY